MVGKRAQISIEYMLITGFVLVAILIPIFLFLFPAVTGSVNSSLNDQTVQDLGNGFVNDAKQMYYLGLYSHKIATYEIPRHIQNLYVLNFEKDDKIYYYVGIVIEDKYGKRAINFQSDIPVISEEIDGYVEVRTGISHSLTDYVKECQDSGVTCTFYDFIGSSVKSGKRDFKIETVYDNDLNRAITKIYPMVY